MPNSNSPDIVSLSDTAYEAVQSITRLEFPRGLPAPIAYDALDSLQALSHMQSDVLGAIADALGRSLEEYDVYDEDGADPAQAAATAVDHLVLASRLARQMGLHLERAQGAISRQNYRTARGQEERA